MRRTGNWGEGTNGGFFLPENELIISVRAKISRPGTRVQKPPSGRESRELCAGWVSSQSYFPIQCCRPRTRPGKGITGVSSICDNKQLGNTRGIFEHCIHCFCCIHIELPPRRFRRLAGQNDPRRCEYKVISYYNTLSILSSQRTMPMKSDVIQHSLVSSHDQPWGQRQSSVRFR